MASTLKFMSVWMSCLPGASIQVLLSPIMTHSHLQLTAATKLDYLPKLGFLQACTVKNLYWLALFKRCSTVRLII